MGININMKDEKTQPRHYTDFSITPIDAIEIWGLGFSTGNAVKYIARAGKKEGETALDDLKKAQWYLSREIKRITDIKNKEENDCGK